jgi:molybdenum cofactor synthesis domain-containing protein
MAVKINAALITVSDRCARGEQEDVSGPVLAKLLHEMGAEVPVMDISPDDPETLRDKLRRHADRADINLVVTTGGTGVSPRDNTPEATRAVIEREVPGMAEAMRAASLKRTEMAMISRGVCGIRGGALIINLPGSPAGARECFEVVSGVIPHALALLAGKPHSEA